MTGGRRRGSTGWQGSGRPRPAAEPTGSILGVQILWLVAIVVVVVGGYLLTRTLAKLSAALEEVNQSMSELGQMGPQLEQLGKELGDISDTLERRRPQ